MEMLHGVNNPAGIVFAIIGFHAFYPSRDYLCNTQNVEPGLYLWYECLPGLTHLCLSETTVLIPACTTYAFSLLCGPAHTYSPWPPNSLSWPVPHVPFFMVRPDPPLPV